MKRLAKVAMVAVVVAVALGATLPYESVKAQLRDVESLLKVSAGRYDNAAKQVIVADNTLDAMATNYADLIETIDGYAPSDAAETLAKAELAKFISRRAVLKANTAAAKAAFAAIEAHGAAAVKAKLAELD